MRARTVMEATLAFVASVPLGDRPEAPELPVVQAQLKKAGIEINDVADKKQFQAAVKPVWDKYGAKYADLVKRIQAVS